MDWLAKGAEEDATHFKSAFLMKVFFGGNMPPAQSADMLRKFKADCETYLEKMGETPDSIGKYGSNKEKYRRFIGSLLLTLVTALSKLVSNGLRGAYRNWKT